MSVMVDARTPLRPGLHELHGTQERPLGDVPLTVRRRTASVFPQDVPQGTRITPPDRVCPIHAGGPRRTPTVAMTRS